MVISYVNVVKLIRHSINDFKVKYDWIEFRNNFYEFILAIKIMILVEPLVNILRYLTI